MGNVIVGGLLLALAVMSVVHRRRQRVEWTRLADAQRAGLGQVIEELAALRAALANLSGARKRPPRLPPEPPPLPSVKREVVTVTRDDDPIHTRPTVEAPPPFEDQLGRAMRRIERQARVPPEVEARWEQRLRALGAELGLTPHAEPTDAQLDAMIRELYEAEADVKDARLGVLPPPLEATLSSAVSPIAVRMAQTATRPDDAEGETTLRRQTLFPLGGER